MEKFCYHCGRQIKKFEKFCESCGSKLDIGIYNILYCENCGSRIVEDAKFCEMCGQRILSTDEQKQREEQKKVCDPDKERTEAIARQIIAVLAILSSLLMLVLIILIIDKLA